jgi:hypothetical protein
LAKIETSRWVTYRDPPLLPSKIDARLLTCVPVDSPGSTAVGVPARGTFCAPRTSVGLPGGSAQNASRLAGIGVVSVPDRLMVPW